MCVCACVGVCVFSSSLCLRAFFSLNACYLKQIYGGVHKNVQRDSEHFNELTSPYPTSTCPPSAVVSINTLIKTRGNLDRNPGHRKHLPCFVFVINALAQILLDSSPSGNSSVIIIIVARSCTHHNEISAHFSQTTLVNSHNWSQLSFRRMQSYRSIRCYEVDT